MQNYIQKLYLRRQILRNPPLGIGIALELTDECNLRCSFCPQGRKNGRPGGMAFELFKRLADEAIATNRHIKWISLVGLGEPLLYPKLYESIRYVKDNYPKAKVSLATNGILLNGENAQLLMDSGLDQICLSLNFFSKDKYMDLCNTTEKVFELVYENVKKFLSLKRKRRLPYALIQIFDTINGTYEIKEFRNFWKPYMGKGAKIYVQPFLNWGGLVELRQWSDDHSLPGNVCRPPSAVRSKEEIPRTTDHGPRTFSTTDRYPCAYLYSWMVISKDGYALACCKALSFEEEALVLGNIKEESLKDLYLGEKMDNLRRLHLMERWDEISLCAKCNSWKTIPNIWFRNRASFERRWI